MIRKKVVAIIQAHMGSSRLPGKTLADIAGKPMLVRVVERARLAKTLDTIVVAATTDPLDKKIADLCRLHAYKIFLGSALDVLDRYYRAAKENKADVIVRLCADSPLIDPGLIDEVVLAFLSADPPVDYTSNRIQRTYPVGLDTEVFSFAALERAWSETKEGYQREHVTPYMYDPETPCKAMSVSGKDLSGHYRWTVDMPEDLELVRRVYRHFEDRDSFTWLEVIDLMRKNPELANININIKQKDYKSSDYRYWRVCEKRLKRKKIIFRIIGGGKFGMGHIYRSMALAQVIAGQEVRFVCDAESKPAADKLLGHLYWLGVYESNEIADQIISMQPDLVVNDMLDTDRVYVQRLHDHGIKVINFEDIGSGAAHADLTINELYDNTVIPGRNILWGHGYFFIRDEFNGIKTHRFAEKISCLLITFGGTDPSDFTRRVLRAVINFCRENRIKIIIVTGPGYLYINELKKDISKINDVDIEYTHSTGAMASIMEKAEIAITSNGRTIYEMAHMKIPSIVLSHHERENTHFFANEMDGFIPIGIYEGQAKEAQMLAALKRLVQDVAYRKLLFDRMKRFRFDKNKKKVAKLISKVLGS